MIREIATITPPTPNGDLHLGHIAGPYLAADVYSRTQRLLGSNVVLLCYSDDYQSYLARKAREVGAEPFALGRRNGAMIAETLKAIDVELDEFLQAGHNDHFKSSVTLFYRSARERGALEKKNSRVPYFPAYGVYGYEAFGRGECNHCGASSDGSQCEACAHAPDLEAMQKVCCTLGDSPVEWREIRREYLRLGAFKPYLAQRYQHQPLRAHLRKFIDEVLALPNLDWPITRPHECGIVLDEPGQPNPHTWFCGIAGYHAAFAQWAERQGHPGWTDQFWRGGDTVLTHFLGFDCSFSHAIVYPVLLSLVDGFTQNVRLYTNRFLTLEGRNFSTSRGHAIWVRDLLKAYPSDAVRLYLALNSPEEEVRDFRMADFTRWYESKYLGEVLRLCDAAIQPGSLAPSLPSGSTRRIDAALAAWRGHADSATFSMRQLAAASTLLLDLAAEEMERDPPSARVLFALYAVLASPLHPRLSAGVLKRAGLSDADVRAWLGELLGASARRTPATIR